jgi:hypothetical protein
VREVKSIKQVRLRPLGKGRSSKAYLIDESYVICSNGEEVDLIRVKSTGETDTYRPSECYNHITVAKGGRSESALKKIVDKLKTMSAYTLLTEHYDITEEKFYINKNLRGK